jgi:transposase
LVQLAASRTAALREVERAKVLLADSVGKSPTEIQRTLGVSRPTICKCIDKALAAGVATGLRDRYHRPRAPEITEAAKAWVVDLACRKPKDVGTAAELWTLSALAEHMAANAANAGFPRLSKAGKTTVWRILDSHELEPHRVRHCLERRDAGFERKMAEVLVLFETKYQSVDQAVGARQQRFRDCQTELPGRLHVDDQLECRRLFDGKLSGPGTREDAMHEARHHRALVRDNRAVRHQTAVVDEQRSRADRRQAV